MHSWLWFVFWQDFCLVLMTMYVQKNESRVQEHIHAADDVHSEVRPGHIHVKAPSDVTRVLFSLQLHFA